MLLRRNSVLAALIAASAGLAHAQPLTRAFTYQGELADGGALASGPYDLRFRLYDAASGGGQLGGTICLNNVSVVNGRFTVPLDFGAVFNGRQVFLETDVRADTGRNCGNATGFVTLSPRQALTAAPHALFALGAGSAGDAARLNGQAGGFYQDAGNLTAGTIPDGRLGGTYSGPLTLNNPGNTVRGSFTGTGAGLTEINASGVTLGTLPVGVLPNPLELSGIQPTCIVSGVNGSSAGGSGGVCGYATSLFGATNGVYGQSSSNAGTGVYGWASNTSGVTQGVYGAAESTSGRGVYGLANATSGQADGVFGESRSTNGTGVVGSATSIVGTTFGGKFFSAGADGTGLYAEASSATGTHGVFGRSNGLFGRGVYGLSTNTNDRSFGVFGQCATRIGAGVYGENNTTSGNLAYGGEFVSQSTGGQAVRGRAMATSGTTYGGFFTTASSTGTGVFASGGSRGVHGQSQVVGGVGVYGRSFDQSGVGVFGEASSLIATVYGVFGQASPGAGFAVYANGNMGASGLKSFRIDHPDDPENKYLLHYAPESPEALNFYSGKVDLDGDGEAVVELPGYFAKINTDPRYTLTALGAPMPMLHVAAEISGEALARGAAAGPGEAAPACTFVIAGGAPGGRVSWRVEAVRNDLYARARGAPVEAEKLGVEKGRYQHPDLYGLPPERGIDRPRDGAPE